MINNTSSENEKIKEIICNDNNNNDYFRIKVSLT